MSIGPKTYTLEIGAPDGYTNVKYIRADVAEQMAEALRGARSVMYDPAETRGRQRYEVRAVYDALAAYEQAKGEGESS